MTTYFRDEFNQTARDGAGASYQADVGGRWAYTNSARLPYLMGNGKARWGTTSGGNGIAGVGTWWVNSPTVEPDQRGAASFEFQTVSSSPDEVFGLVFRASSRDANSSYYFVRCSRSAFSLRKDSGGSTTTTYASASHGHSFAPGDTVDLEGGVRTNEAGNVELWGRGRINGGSWFSLSTEAAPSVDSSASRLLTAGQQGIRWAGMIATSNTTGLHLDRAQFDDAVVVGVPDVAVSLSHTTGSVRTNQSASSTVTIERLNGFTGDVALALSGVPEGVTAVLSTETLGGGQTQATLTVIPDRTVPLGTLGAITVTASAAGSEKTATFTLTHLQAPTMVLSASTLTFTGQAGGAAPASQFITITNGGTGEIDPESLSAGPITYTN